MTIETPINTPDFERLSFKTVIQSASYDPQLIERLKEDHAELSDIFTRLGTTTKLDLNSVQPDLIQLRSSFQKHIQTEKIYFYSYLDRLLVDHPTVREEAHVVWLDMNDIANSIAHFIHEWTASLPTEETLPLFLEHLGRTQKILFGRIELEENTLYTLYTETL